MAGITASAFSTGSGAASTTVSAPCPAGVAVGDLMLIWMATITASETFSCPPFTAVTASTGQNCSTQLLYHTATSIDVALSGSSGSYTVTCSASKVQSGII